MDFLDKRRLRCKLFSDTLFSKTKSLKGNVCAQVFVTENFIRVYPMRSKGQAGEPFREFTDDVGAPNEIVVDQAPEQVGPNTEFRSVKNWIKYKKTMQQRKVHHGKTEPKPRSVY